MSVQSYTYPKNLPEALAARKEKYLPYGGGTDLMLQHQDELKKGQPLSLCFLGHVPELHGITWDSNGITIGAMTSMAEIAGDDRLPVLLREACLGVGSPGLRNVATLGGNICMASPAGDSLPPLYVHGAEVLLCSKQGERRVGLDDFITGVGRTALNNDELLISVFIPKMTVSRYFYRKVSSRVSNAISKISIAASLLLDGTSIVDIRLAYGAVGPTVIRLHEVESFLTGQELDEVCDSFDEWAYRIRDGVQPIDDLRSTALYRREVAVNLCRIFLKNESGEIPSD